MNHSDIQARMADYLDGELSLDFRALFDAHLDQCDACSGELSDMRDTIRLLRTLPNPEPPADLVSDVMRRIVEGEGQSGWFGSALDWLSHYLVPRIAIPVTAVAAALTLTVITGDLNLDTLNFSRPTPSRQRPATATIALTLTQDLTQDQSPTPAPPSVARVAPGDRVPRVLAKDRVLIAEIPQLRYEAETGAGFFLFRVGADQRGPIRLLPKDGDFASRIFHVTSTPAQGPYLRVLMAPSLTVGPGSFGFVGTNPRQGSGLEGRLTQVSVSRPTPVPSDAVGGMGGTEELSLETRRQRELDKRLSFLYEDPPGFAQGMANDSLAEQEIWLRQLAARAEEIGEVERVLSALEGSGDDEALRLAREFELAVKHNHASWAAAKTRSASD
jgi:hypothetical protein